MQSYFFNFAYLWLRIIILFWNLSFNLCTVILVVFSYVNSLYATPISRSLFLAAYNEVRGKQISPTGNFVPLNNTLEAWFNFKFRLLMKYFYSFLVRKHQRKTRNDGHYSYSSFLWTFFTHFKKFQNNSSLKL